MSARPPTIRLALLVPSATLVSAALVLGLGSADIACSSTNVADLPRDAATDGDADGALADAGPAADALPSDLENGTTCAASSQCRGGCCELHSGSKTVCAQSSPFDPTQNCACQSDQECAAIMLCGHADFCQEANDVSAQRFCSRVCR